MGPLARGDAVGAANGCNGTAGLGTLPPLLKSSRVLGAWAADGCAFNPLYMVLG